MNSCKRRIFTDLERILYSIGFIFPSLNTLSLMGVKYSSIISLSLLAIEERVLSASFTRGLIFSSDGITFNLR